MTFSIKLKKKSNRFIAEFEQTTLKKMSQKR